jgi:hypothetical protein
MAMREAIMKIFISVFSVLSAILLMSSLTSFAGTGPFGAFGPATDSFMAQEVDHTLVSMGTGPYGVFTPVEGYNIIPGAEKTPMAFAWGTGPYGVLNSHGLVARDKSNRENCLLVASICPLRGVSR